MVVEKEFFNVKYKEGSLDAKTAQLIHFAVSVAIGYEFGAQHHLTKARECGATEDEITETLVYTMRPATAKVRKLGTTLSRSRTLDAARRRSRTHRNPDRMPPSYSDDK